MKDLYPKFIIEEGNLILSKVTFHKELVTDKSLVKGGGFFDFDDESNSFTFYGKSSDFGASDINDIKECIDNKKVFTNKMLTRNISEKFNFYFNNESEIIKLK